MMLAIEKLASDLGKQLKRLKLTLATAESCTGGGLSYWITSIAGSSSWFDRGFVTYSDESKITMLGVTPQLLSTYGAISEQVATSMAQGGLTNSQADCCIAITGIAGPDGGSLEKPVGTVWVSIGQKNKEAVTFMDRYHGDRQHIRMRVMERALEKAVTLLY